MLKRKFMSYLIDWKNTKKNECLLVKGARQIGKTFIIDRFGRDNYESYIYINFLENDEYLKIFDGSLKAEDIYKKISLFIPHGRFIPHNTLIFLDEIQICPNARSALKFLALDDKYDVVASGSLLGINYKEVSSIPVGYERQVEMHSLDFEEFLWAIGIDETVLESIYSYYRELKQVPEAINDKMMAYLREYIVVGGMPSVVNEFVSTNNYFNVQTEQQRIIDSYLDDIAKYAANSEKPKARNCFLSVPKQLAKEYRKFQFSVVDKGASSRKYANSLEWLRDANFVRFCFNVSTPSFPLVAYEKEDQYKIYLNDIGLLTSLYGFDMKKAIIENTLTGDVKGGIYENLVADMLLKRGIKLNYYKFSNSTQEIEFLLTRDSKVVPVEVKASNGKSVSLNTILKSHEIDYGYKLISGNIGKIDKKITLPIYMALYI